MANYLDETGLGTLISLIKQWTLDEISASSGGGGGSLYVLPTATSSALGGIKIGYSANGKNYPVALDGEGRAYVNVPWTDPESPAEPYQLPAASASTRGGVRVGDNLSVTDTDKLGLSAEFLERISNIEESTGEPYQLPVATASTLGGVKVGAGLSVAGDGTLSAPALDMQPISDESIDEILASLGGAAGA